jgi:hypothetical protein
MMGELGLMPSIMMGEVGHRDIAMTFMMGEVE